jgi:hypothetical protein
MNWCSKGYLASPDYRPGDNRGSAKRKASAAWLTPGDLAVLVGRNNRQNDLLISSVATDYDLWFHTQEIPGSHVLLRLQPGQVPSDRDLQYVADLTAYFSRARQADQVPVVYTQPSMYISPRALSRDGDLQTRNGYVGSTWTHRKSGRRSLNSKRSNGLRA